VYTPLGKASSHLGQEEIIVRNGTSGSYNVCFVLKDGVAKVFERGRVETKLEKLPGYPGCSVGA
jgi:hypothetical protein